MLYRCNTIWFQLSVRGGLQKSRWFKNLTYQQGQQDPSLFLSFEAKISCLILESFLILVWIWTWTLGPRINQTHILKCSFQTIPDDTTTSTKITWLCFCNDFQELQPGISLLSWLTAQIYLSRLAGRAKKETLASFTTVLDFCMWKYETILE